MKKRILVTGGAGFIGSHLCSFLIENGDAVICLDNFTTGSKNNISHLIGHPDFEVMEADIVSPINVDSDISQIYNLACPASPVAYQSDPVKTITTNVVGMYNVLEFAKAKKIPVLQASTSEIYGDPEVHPQVET